MEDKFKHFYKLNYETRIFYDRQNRKEKTYHILYLHDNENEITNFVKTFVVYLPAYSKNNTMLKYLFNSGDIEENLLKESLKIFKNSKSLPHRNYKIDGLYGELFLDFYSRIVKDENFFITYAAKRPYDLNYESFGYDAVYYTIDDNNNISLILSESKFVSSKSSCNRSFLVDINGNEKEKSHFTREYFNDYIGYILEKESYETYTDINKKEIIKNFVDELNKWANEGKNYIDFIITNNIYVNVVLFGIFCDDNENIVNFEDVYDNLEKELELRLIEMGLVNFKIEIVFIPTKSKSVTIKGEINDFYGKI